VVSSIRGDRRTFVAEAFYIRHCLSVTLAPKARLKISRCVAIAARYRVEDPLGGTSGERTVENAGFG
jgi:hypothetical protein